MMPDGPVGAEAIVRRARATPSNVFDMYMSRPQTRK